MSLGMNDGEEETSPSGENTPHKAKASLPERAESSGLEARSQGNNQMEDTSGDLHDEVWRNFNASRRKDTNEDTTEDGDVLVHREADLDLTGNRRNNAIRRKIRFASCGCPILRVSDFFQCASGDLVCMTKPGHAVRCSKCGLVYSWKTMTIIGQKKYCKGCRREAWWLNLWAAVWVSILSALSRFGG